MTLRLPENVLDRLKTARRVVVLTGGGMAAESGVPSFRDSHVGPWAQYDVSELATPQAFLRNPRLVWEWYDYRRRAADRAEPSKAHYGARGPRAALPELPADHPGRSIACTGAPARATWWS